MNTFECPTVSYLLTGCCYVIAGISTIDWGQVTWPIT